MIEEFDYNESVKLNTNDTVSNSIMAINVENQ